MKKIKRYLIVIATIVLIVHSLLYLTNNTHIYQLITKSIIHGNFGASIDDLKRFETREINKETSKVIPKSFRYNQQLLDSSSNSFLDLMKTKAFLVLHNDSIVLEIYKDEYDSTTLSNSFSVAKSFVTLLVGIAIKEKKIKSLQEPIIDFFPELKNNNVDSEITIEHLASMSSGLDFVENYSSPFAYPAKAYYGSDIKKLTLNCRSKEKPGKNLEYLSGNTELLALIIERATHQKLSEYMSNKLWKPIEAEQKAYWSLDKPNGTEKAFCCFYSCARDFARIGQLMLHSGTWNKEELIDSTYISYSTKAFPLHDKESINQRYGLGWWLIPSYRDQRIYYARGIKGQYIIIIPGKNMVIVRLGSKRIEPLGIQHPPDLYKYIDIALETS